MPIVVATPTVPTFACAPWAAITDVCAPCTTGIDAALLSRCLSAATDVLYQLSGRQYSGQCVAEGSMVQSEFGPKPIEQVQAGEQVWAWTANGPVLRPVTAVHDNGVRKVVEVRLLGRSIRVTPDHLLLALRRGKYLGHNKPIEWWTEWVEARHVRRGDQLIAHDELGEDQPDSYLPDGTLIDHDVAWLLGLWLGDGWLETDSVGLSGGGKPIERAAEILSRVWGLELKQKAPWTYRAFSRSLRRSLHAVGYGKRAHQKQIPDLVWALSPKLQRSFLTGYQAADGCWNRGFWSHSSASFELIRQARSLAMRLGDPVGNIYAEERPADMKPIVPKYPDALKNAKTLWHFDSHPNQRRRGQRITRFRGARDAIGVGLRPMRVLSVEECDEARVFDLSVEEHHNFFAEGIVVHNCVETVRPCAKSVATDHGRPIRGSWPWGSGVGYWSGSAWQGSTSPWGWCLCNRTERAGCYSVPEVALPGYPVTQVMVVKVDGLELTNGVDYRIDDDRFLVRLPDPVTGAERGWPCHQRLTLPDTEPDTWSVQYKFGNAPPVSGVLACAELACQLALALSPQAAGECKLPKRVTSLTRQGMTAVVLDPMAFLDKGKTGLYDVDLFLSSCNRAGIQRRATAWHPEMGRRTSRRTGTA